MAVGQNRRAEDHDGNQGHRDEGTEDNWTRSVGRGAIPIQLGRGGAVRVGFGGCGAETGHAVSVRQAAAPALNRD
jgi:hypothetical protein